MEKNESKQKNESEINQDFPYQAYQMDGNLVLQNLNTGKIIELDFNATEKMEKIKNSEDPNKVQKLIDFINDLDKGIVDGQPKEVGIPEETLKKKANESDDKIYNMDEEISGDDDDNEHDPEAIKKRREEAREDLLNKLQSYPYEIPLDTIKDFTLEQLKEKKASFDMLPLIRDFIKEKKPLTHRDIKKNAFDMNEPKEYNLKSSVFRAAQMDFIEDVGEKRYKRDFGYEEPSEPYWDVNNLAPLQAWDKPFAPESKEKTLDLSNVDDLDKADFKTPNMHERVFKEAKNHFKDHDLGKEKYAQDFGDFEEE